jgi:putative FmdB family regulatory protein
MPIYAYKCAACGFAQDEMQKVSDAPLSVCPSCGKADYAKQVTAAGFALKGTGWYATDFKGGSKPEAKSEAPSHACGTGACPACN